MYKIGDKFVYGSNGVCEIKDIQESDTDFGTRKYYILSPYREKNETIFVPVDNDNLVQKMKELLSKDDVEELIKSLPKLENIWIDDISERRTLYKAILKSADRKKIFSLIKTLKHRKSKLEEDGKKLSVYDERSMRSAIEILHGEFALVLGIPFEDVEPYILKRAGA